MRQLDKGQEETKTIATRGNKGRGDKKKYYQNKTGSNYT